MAQLPGEARRTQYTATALQTVFIYDFLVYEDDEITVQQNDTTLTLTTHYTVQDAGETAGGTITLVTGATVGDTITITGNTMIERETTFTTGGDFLASAINAEYDRLDNITKELISSQGDNFRLAVYSDTVSKTVPSPSTRKALVWNTAGTALENSTYDPDTAQGTAAASAAAAVVSAAAASTSAGEAAVSAAAALVSEGNASDSADAAAASAASFDLTAVASNLIPDADSTRDFGSTGTRWNDGFIDALTITDTLSVNGVSVTGLSAIEAVIYGYTVAKNTAGGAYTTLNTWQDRPLNDTAVSGSITGASVDTNTLTLPAGTFYVHCKMWCYGTIATRGRLYDGVSATICEGYGGMVAANNYNYPVMFQGIFTLATATAMTLQMYASAAVATNGMGYPNNIQAETYTELAIIKLA